MQNQNLTLEKMKAIFIEDFGGPEQLKNGQLTIPLPGSGEVQIKIAYTAVNPVDWKVRLGLLQKRIPHHFPLIPGWDAAGIISALGSHVTKFKVGDAVFAYCRKSIVQNGTYAEYVCHPADEVVLKPQILSFAQAAALPLGSLTAWQALFDAANLKKGETVLIQAGAGGVESLAVQFAKEAGAYVITTARAAHHPYVKSLGADLIIDYQTHSILEEVKKIDPMGLDVVFDLLGGETLKESFSLLKIGGRLVSIVEQPDPELAKNFQVSPFYLFASPNGKQLQYIADLIQAGKIAPIQIQEMPLDKAAEAQEKVREGHVQGKIVLHVQELS